MAKSIPNAFYKSAKWIKCRDSYMASQHYICERCGGLASICHHKVYLNAENYKNPHISLNHDHLEALCQTCHNQEHFGGQVIGKGLQFDGEGNIIKI
ncbi:HNH endonuclease [Staphylococcus simulans]|uniref:HNH endonuclease n=1 Tax=Staphylococcus simulans TaxID=1286 RepID=UPI003F81F8F1